MLDLQLDLAQISPETFSLLRELTARLRALSAELHDGTGFVVVRGLIPDDYDERQSVIAFEESPRTLAANAQPTRKDTH
jgi:uncharacterized membrane protein